VRLDKARMRAIASRTTRTRTGSPTRQTVLHHSHPSFLSTMSTLLRHSGRWKNPPLDKLAGKYPIYSRAKLGDAVSASADCTFWPVTNLSVSSWTTRHLAVVRGARFLERSGSFLRRNAPPPGRDRVDVPPPRAVPLRRRRWSLGRSLRASIRGDAAAGAARHFADSLRVLRS